MKPGDQNVFAKDSGSFRGSGRFVVFLAQCPIATACLRPPGEALCPKSRECNLP
jgi:hypothetical protein